jgi:phenylacetate-CoA oxygenase PaaH subunit
MMDVYEVFQQEREGAAMRHAGSVRAPDPDLAEHYAREFYGRRQESVRLWVVPRAAIREVADPDLLQPPLDRSFKKPVGYSAGIKAKLAEVRTRAGAQPEQEGRP